MRNMKIPFIRAIDRSNIPQMIRAVENISRNSLFRLNSLKDLATLAVSMTRSTAYRTTRAG
jgi:hypothetical protein